MALDHDVVDVSEVGNEIYVAHEQKFDSTPIQVLYYPDYRATNAYQSIIYSNLTENAKVSPVKSVQEVLDALKNGSSVLFHLHWIDPIFASAKTEDDKRLVAHVFTQQLREIRRLGGKIVWTIHNEFPHDRNNIEFLQNFYAEVARLAHKIHVHSEAAKAIISKSYSLEEPSKTCVVIPHPSYMGVYPSRVSKLEARALLGIPEDAFVIGSIGQIRPYKGLESLFSCIEKLVEEHTNIVLLVAGKPVHPIKSGYWMSFGEMFDWLYVFEGFIQDVDLSIYFDAVDVVALPYTDILTSGSVNLAATFGKPVLVPKIQTLSHVLEFGFGIGYEPNSEVALQLAIKEIIRASSSSLAAMSDKAKEFAFKFSPDVISKDFLKLFGSIFGEKCNKTSEHTGSISVIKEKEFSHSGSLGISIVNYKNAYDVIRLLETVPATAGGRMISIWILDNSFDSILDVIDTSKFANVMIFRSTENLGFAGGVNFLLKVMRLAGCEFAFNLNPDVRLEKGSLEPLIQLASEMEATIFSPVILRDSGKVSFAGAFLKEYPALQIVQYMDGEPLSKVPLEIFYVDALNGCAFFFKLSNLDKLGPLPEEYFLYFEETDWFLNARKNGFRCAIVPQSLVTHNKVSHGSSVPSLYYVYYFIRSNFIFASKLGRQIAKVDDSTIKTFIDGWERRLLDSSPDFLTIFRRTVSIAIQDGFSKNVGRVDLSSKLDDAQILSDAASIGRIESIAGSTISGWAVSSSDQGMTWEAGKLWLVVDDIPVLSFQATLDRQDVQAAGFCLKAGFICHIPDYLNDGSERQIEIRHAESGLRVLRNGSDELTWRHRLLPLSGADTEIIGYVDHVTNGVLRGWAFDKRNPGRTVIIDIDVDGARIDGVPAQKFRADLKANNFGAGFHGIEIPLPHSLLEKRVFGVTFFINGSNKKIHSNRISIDFKSSGFQKDFSPIEYFRWAFANHFPPAGACSESSQLMRFFKMNRELLNRSEAVNSQQLFSVIMPVFNREATVTRAIASLIAQNYKNWELIVIDDASTDNSISIIEHLIQTTCINATIIKHSANRGASAARNTGLEKAKGSLIAYLDSDNEWYPEYLDSMAEIFFKNPDCDTAYAGLEVYEWLDYFQTLDFRTIHAKPFNNNGLKVRNFIDLNVFCHRQDCISRYGKFREEIRRLVDWDLIIRYTKEKPPIFVPALLAKYYIDQNAQQISSTESFLSSYRIVMSQIQK